MIALLFGLLVMGILEISIIVAVAGPLGWMLTLLILILSSAAGAWVVKREGTATWRRVMAGVRAGQMPTTSLLDGCLIVVAGFLLLVPGFLTDIAGMALAVPAVRKVVRLRAVDSLQRRIAAQVSRTRSSTVFGFGQPGGFGNYRRPDDGFAGATGSRRPVRDDDVIDLDAEEVVFVDEPIAELDPPQEPPA